MARRLRRLLFTGLIALFPHASAWGHPDSNPFLLTCVLLGRPMNVSNLTPHSIPSPGLFFAATDPQATNHAPGGGDDFTWNFNGTCSNNGVAFMMSGVGNGYCERFEATGSGVMGGHTFSIQMTSAGTTILLTHPSAAGVLEMTGFPLPGSPNGNCLNGTAITFGVSGLFAHGTNP